MPGALKNALDGRVSSGELYRKPVMALSASPSDRGGDRALASLRQTLGALDTVVLEDGRIVDLEVEARIRAAVRALSA
ncbi:NADPH-dependent FMN reductase [Rubrivirga sp.]|uniref:NADPH-dependent FMN reductase n=1 Tax=Rubrivirga sp. TaxID=1885344 RepID=UPI003C759670